MTPFWIAAGALLALALGLVLPALLRAPRASAAAPRSRANLDILREQLAALDAELASGTLDAAAHARARAEIERRVLDEEAEPALAPASVAAPRAPGTALVLALALPAVALALYGALGNRDALAPRAEPPAAAASVSEADVVAMVEQLARRMETMAGQPNELEGWVLLARSYAAMQRFDEADRAWQRAIALAPQEAQFYADRADVLAMKQDRSLAGEPLALVEQALKLDPANLKALVLAGSAAFDRQDWAGAADYWTRARLNVPAGSELAATIDASLAEARSRSGAASAPAAAAPAVIRGRLSLAPALAARVGPDDTVFVFARAANGPRMPLAIRRHRAAELPLEFTLDDSLAMSPERKLSSAAQVVVGARVSKSGDATPRSGDLVATPVPAGAGVLELVIDAVEP